MEGFQVDVILSSLKELQKEKCRNEKLLAEEYAKRRNFEVQLQAINSKLQATTHINSKMKETLQVTCLKVDQSQTQAKMFEQLNDERREKITKLNSQISGMDRVRQQNMESYGSQMTILTERFRSAWHDQGDDALDTKLDHIRKDKDYCLAKTSENKIALDELVRELETVAVENSNKEVLEALGGVHIETWKATIAMFESENKAAKMAVEKRQHEETKKLASIENKRAELMKSLLREEPRNCEE